MLRSVRIKDHYAEQRLFMRRALASAAVIVLAIMVLLGRLIYLQIIQYDYYLDLSQGNRIRTEPVPPNRGLIFDRNGIALGLNRPTYQLELVREQVPDVDAALNRLAALDLLDPADIPTLKKEIRSRRPFEAVPIKLQLTEQELARFAVRRQEFPGIEIQPRMTRYYPLGASVVHAIGYVGAISADDQKNIDVDEYAGTTLIGKSGVEKTYEQQLHGKTGYQDILVNAQGRRVELDGQEVAGLQHEEPVAGKDLILTIDERVQHAAEDMLRGHRGAAVAIDPNNGDVLALVSSPGFDPNLFSRGISTADYKRLTDDPDLPLYNRALRGVYPPGSTVKPFMALAALHFGVLTADDARYCGGKFRLPGTNHEWRDFRPQGHGYLVLRQAIEESCDVYFYGVANDLGIDHISEFLGEFGFGKPVGIDIGGERSGILPSRDWKRKAFKDGRWYPGDTVNIGIGQGFLSVTPMQLAHAVGIIATRGKNFEPRVVRAIRDSVTGKVKQLDPVALQAVPVKLSYWDAVVDGMTRVTDGAHGTARSVGSTAQYVFAGKTGTAQAVGISQYENIKAVTKTLSERKRDHAWFIAFAPAKDPKIAAAVIVENGGQGGLAAAPVARRIFDTYLLTPEALKAQDAAGKSPGITVTDHSGDGE